jgi:hypothetical protein
MLVVPSLRNAHIFSHTLQSVASRRYIEMVSGFSFHSVSSVLSVNSESSIFLPAQSVPCQRQDPRL